MPYYSSIKYIALALFIGVGGFLYMITAQAVETDCGRYTPSTPPPTGYGAAYNVFSPSQMLVKVFCDTAGVRLQAGAGGTDQVVYEKGWHYRNGAWSEITLSGATRYGGASSPWFTGSAQAVIAKSLWQNGANYVVAYVCVDQGGQWKCGCSDTTCAVGKWQLQAFTPPPECTKNSDCEQEVGKRMVCSDRGSCHDECGTPGTSKKGCSCPNVGLRTNCDSFTICGDNHVCIRDGEWCSEHPESPLCT